MLKRVKAVVFLFLFLFVNIYFYAQSDDDGWKKASDKFYLTVLAKELLNANLSQLKDMAKSLGLPEASTALDYRKSIASFYNIQLIEPVQANGDKIKLERAGELKVIKLTDVNEENLHIMGKVRLIISGKDETGAGTQRKIEADEVFIDTKNKNITGTGNVVYTDDKLEFKGAHFYYNYGINKGILLDGRTKILKNDESGLQGAYFTGKKLSYLSKDESILYDGKLTTCDAADPHYHIMVDRLWLNKENEWGLLNGVVYVGPMPFLYFPVYYHPKNIEVHPSFGYRTKEGWFFQTTYSIIGKLKADESSSAGTTSTSANGADFGVSVRRADPSQSELFTLNKVDLEKKLNEIYDKDPFYKKYPQFRILPEFNKIDLALRFFADAYYNLGFYGGSFFYFNMEHPAYTFKLKLLTDYGASRKIWKDTSSSVYLPYDPDDKALDYDASTKRNTYFFSETNPYTLRTAQYLKVNGDFFRNTLNLKTELEIEYASDTSFYKDFYNRDFSFTYFDLLGDLLQYNMELKDSENTIFKSAAAGEVSKETSLTDNFIINISPKLPPDLFGLYLLSAFKLDITTSASFLPNTITDYVPEDTETEIDHRSEKYLIDTVNVPKVDVSASGTLIDYDVFKDMPSKINNYINSKMTKTEKNSVSLQNFYDLIDYVNKIDSTSDKTTVNFKDMLAFYSDRTEINGGSKDITGFYDRVASDTSDYDLSLKSVVNDTATPKAVSDYGTYFTPEIEKNFTSQDIKIVGFNVKYNLSDALNNKFLFYKDSDKDHPWYDSVQEIITKNFDYNKNTQRFNVNNVFALDISGTFTMFSFPGANGGLTGFNPKLSVIYKKDWDFMTIYSKFIKIKYNSGTEWDTARIAVEYENRKASEFTLNYSDKVTTDLSFGNYFIKGTGIESVFSTNLYKYNEQESYNFKILNDINENMETEGYEEVDTEDYYNDINAYFKIKELYTTLQLKLNLLPEGWDHKLDISAGPKINYIINSTTMDTLKSELWTEESGSVKYLWADVSSFTDYKKTEVSSITDQAKDYVYYRKKDYNLFDKVSEFYKGENFWQGQKNFRNIFENVSITLNYSYKRDNFSVAELSNIITFKFVNMGNFSNGDGKIADFTVYPDDTFSLSFFNSIINYKLGLTFSKTKDEEKLEKYTTAVQASKGKLDEYNIMTMTNTHTLTLKLAGTQFALKLPKGDWFNFVSTTEIKYEKNKWYKYVYNSSLGDYEWDLYDNNNNDLYFSAQTLKLGVLMDLVVFTLNYKAYNFERGYGLTLDSGSIKLGYDFTEFPELWGFFRIILKPNITYTFTPKKDPYKSGSVLEEYPSVYYDNNKLDFNFYAELIFGEKKDFETRLKFTSQSINKKLYLYYGDDGLKTFFDDLTKSMNFSSEEDRRKSNFNLQKLVFSIEHKLHDWTLYLEYAGAPEKDYTGKKYIWDNTFTFQVNWSLDSKNQLMKLFNKTKINEKYENGKWNQRSMTLDEESSTTTTTTTSQ